jgi:hypothetical protein
LDPLPGDRDCLGPPALEVAQTHGALTGVPAVAAGIGEWLLGCGPPGEAGTGERGTGGWLLGCGPSGEVAADGGIGLRAPTFGHVGEPLTVRLTMPPSASPTAVTCVVTRLDSGESATLQARAHDAGAMVRFEPLRPGLYRIETGLGGSGAGGAAVSELVPVLALDSA